MYATDTILTFGFPLGRLCGARFRVSFLLPLAALAFTWRFQSLPLGALATGILFFSVLAHELAHLVMARSAGGEMDEIRIWPLGGLAEPFGRGHLRDHFRTMMAGPAMNLMLALSCLLTLSNAELLPLLNPFIGFSLVDNEPLVTTACRMAFYLNMILFAVNLLPITPFDGGVLLRTYMTTRFSEVESRDLMVRLGLMFGILGLLTGFVFDVSSLVAMSALVLVLQIHDSARWYETVNDPDSFSEYNFSGMVEEVSDDPFADPFDTEFDSGFDEPSQSEVLDRWRDRREQERLEKENEEREREEQEVDSVLQKLHVHGRESLSSREIHLLNRVSDRYRNRQQH